MIICRVTQQSHADAMISAVGRGVTVRKNGGTGYARPVTLQWYAGPWAHHYDIYVGTSSSSLTRVSSNVHLGPSTSSSDDKKYSSSSDDKKYSVSGSPRTRPTTGRSCRGRGGEDRHGDDMELYDRELAGARKRSAGTAIAA